MNLNKEPIYQQLTRILRQTVLDGEYRAGEQFLTEKHICESYNVSRATAGKALTALVTEGILVFRKGIGTFVSEHDRPHDLHSLISFTAMAEEFSKTPGTVVLDFRTVCSAEAGENIRLQLHPEEGEELYYCRRIRLLDGVPSLLDRRYIRAGFCRGLNKTDLRGSLIRIWSEKYGLHIEETEQYISAVVLGAEEARILETVEGDCALRLSSVGYLKGGEALWYEDSLFPGNQYVIKNRVSNLSGVLPARRIPADDRKQGGF